MKDLPALVHILIHIPHGQTDSLPAILIQNLAMGVYQDTVQNLDDIPLLQHTAPKHLLPIYQNPMLAAYIRNTVRIPCLFQHCMIPGNTGMGKDEIVVFPPANTHLFVA